MRRFQKSSGMEKSARFLIKVSIDEVGAFRDCNRCINKDQEVEKKDRLI